MGKKIAEKTPPLRARTRRGGNDDPSNQGDALEVAQDRSWASPRIPFPADFPSVVIQQPDSSPLRVRAHPDYRAAKGGDTDAAFRLVNNSLDPAKVPALQSAISDRHPIVLAVHAEEAAGRNKIPQAYAEMLARRLGLKTDEAIVVANRPMRTGATALYRIMTRAEFDGPVEAGRDYLIVDDHVSQGRWQGYRRDHLDGQRQERNDSPASKHSGTPTREISRP